jgi:microcystin-dependent protein
MPFIIPNATDTTSGNRYEALDQSEPDSLDFEILGARTTGVINGCTVVAQAVPTNSVNVSSGTVMLNGTVYTVNGVPNHILPQSPANNRFDLVVARLSGNNMAITTCYGSDSLANPVFPRSASRIINTAGLPANSFVNPNTDVVLAAVYRSGGAVVTNARIVDKRVVVSTSIPLKGPTIPAPSLGGEGDLYLKTLVADKDSSGVYVKRAGEWSELAQAGADPGVPIGAIIMWPSSTNSPNPDVWIECVGQELDRTQFADLFAAVGTTYGAGNTFSTFRLPDFRGQFLMGVPTNRVMGTRYGSATNNVTLDVANMPQHNHSLGSGTTSAAGSHQHGSNTGIGGNTGFVVRSSRNFVGGPIATAFGEIPVGGGNQTGGLDNTGFAGSHTHTFSGNTGNAGSGTAFSIEPSNFGIRFFLRYA